MVELSEFFKIYRSHKVTIRDIADTLGLSTATVSMTLAGKGRISEEVRDRILTTARDMGYESNRSGCVLGKKNITIGIFIPRTPEAVQEHLCRGIERACRKNNDLKLTCILAAYDYDTKEELTALADLADQCDGLIVELDKDRESPHAVAIATINEREIPVVSLVVRSGSIRTQMHVSVDGQMAGAVAADLLNLGLRGYSDRSVMMLSGVPDVDIHNDNYRGFIDRCAAIGLNVVDNLPTYDRKEYVRPLLEEALSRHKGLSGIYVSSHLASEVVRCLNAIGCDRDIMVIGTDMTEDNAAEINHPTEHAPLCAVIDQQHELQAELALNHLLDLILCNRSADCMKDKVIPPRVVFGSLTNHYPSK